MDDARTAIARTLARYCQRCDDGDFEAFAELFERSAVLTALGQTHHGRDAIRAFIEASQGPDARGKHLLGQSDVEVDEETGRATALTDYVFIDENHRITAAGRYHDALRRGPDGEWRFTSREIRLLREP